MQLGMPPKFQPLRPQSPLQKPRFGVIGVTGQRPTLTNVHEVLRGMRAAGSREGSSRVQVDIKPGTSQHRVVIADGDDPRLDSDGQIPKEVVEDLTSGLEPGQSVVSRVLSRKANSRQGFRAAK